MVKRCTESDFSYAWFMDRCCPVTCDTCAKQMWSTKFCGVCRNNICTAEKPDKPEFAHMRNSCPPDVPADVAAAVAADVAADVARIARDRANCEAGQAKCQHWCEMTACQAPPLDTPARDLGDLGESASQFTQDAANVARAAAAAEASGALSPTQLEKLHDAAQKKAATPGVQQPAGDATAVSQPMTAAAPVQSPSNNAAPDCDHCRSQCKTEKCKEWCQMNHCQARTKMSTPNCDHCHQTCKTARCKSWCAKNHCGSNPARGETKDDAIERKVKSVTHPGYAKEIQAQVQHEVKERLSDLLKEGQSPTATMGAQAEHGEAAAAKQALEDALASGDQAGIAKAEETVADAEAHKQAATDAGAAKGEAKQALENIHPASGMCNKDLYR